MTLLLVLILALLTLLYLGIAVVTGVLVYRKCRVRPHLASEPLPCHLAAHNASSVNLQGCDSLW